MGEIRKTYAIEFKRKGVAMFLDDGHAFLKQKKMKAARVSHTALKKSPSWRLFVLSLTHFQ